MAAASGTDDDGDSERRAVRVIRPGCGEPGPRYLAPADALVASHWNQQELRGPWINLENGKPLYRHSAAARGRRVTRVPAHCFAVTGPARMQLWYTPAQVFPAVRRAGRARRFVTRG